MKTVLAVIGLVVAIGAHDASRSQAAIRGSTGLYGASGRGDARLILASATGENKTEKACRKKADDMKLNGIIRSDYIQRCISSRSFRDPNVPKLPGEAN